MKKLFAGLFLLTLLIPGVMATNWTFTTPGDNYWIAPAGVSNIIIKFMGGGGSGSPGTAADGYGGGGGASDITYASYTVTPGTNYTLTVGDGAGPTAMGASPLSGQASTAFGSTAPGGSPGVFTAFGGAHNGGDAENSTWNVSTKYGSDGGFLAQLPAWNYTGGLGGYGHGSGGGGGAGASSATTGDGSGGKGAPGIIQVFDATTESVSVNIPAFSAEPTTSSSGVSILFTDESTLINTTTLSYNWSFGDGTYSTTAGDVRHIYSYYGIYTPSLTVTNASMSVVCTRTDYITIQYQPTEFDLQTEPKAVQFHVQTFWGAPLANANVSIVGITTSTGNWDWLVASLGIPLDEVALNDTTMYQEADVNGNVEFLMIPTAKYNVTTTLAGYTFSPFYLTPHDERYSIIADVNASGWFKSGNDTVAQVNVTVSSVKLNDTAGAINVIYNDAGSQTTGGNIYLYVANETDGGANVLIDTIPIASNNQTTNTTVSFTELYGGQNVIVSVEPIRTGGEVVKTFTVWFKGKTVDFAGFDSTVLMWLALFCIIFTAMFAGATHAPQMAIIICVEAWIFYAMGWLDQLTMSVVTPLSGEAGMIALLSFATFIAVAWNFREGKRKEKGT